MDVQDQIILFLKETGPTLPSKVAKNIKTDILIASAHLSDLSSRGKIKISKLKVGSSPLYYLEGQEDQIFNFAQDNLNPKDFSVLTLLKKELVLRENEQDLLTKVALRQIKDFAIPLQVRSSQGIEFFWKWHLLSAEKASEIITRYLNPPKPDPVSVLISEEKKEPITQVQNPPPQSLKNEEREEHVSEPSQTQTLEQSEKNIQKSYTEPISELDQVSPQPKEELSENDFEFEESVQKEPKAKKEEPQSKVSVADTEAKPEEEKVESPIQKEVQKEILESIPEEKELLTQDHTDAEVTKPAEKAQPKKEEPTSEVSSDPIEKGGEGGASESSSKTQEVETQGDEISSNKETTSFPEKKKKQRKNGVEDDFLPMIKKYLGEFDIKIVKKETIRKNKEIDLIVRVPTVVGKLLFYCKAKRKARCDEKDLSSAYMESQIKKLPLLFLYTKDLNKKAFEMLESDAFENAIVKKIEQ